MNKKENKESIYINDLILGVNYDMNAFRDRVDAYLNDALPKGAPGGTGKYEWVSDFVEDMNNRLTPEEIQWLAYQLLINQIEQRSTVRALDVVRQLKALGISEADEEELMSADDEEFFTKLTELLG